MAKSLVLGASTALGATLGLVLGAASAGATASPYVGAEACKGCHESQYQTWQTGPHARADQSVRGVVDAGCRNCHMTGPSPAGQGKTFAGVQCEACHGPGRDYIAKDVMLNRHLATRLGLQPLAQKAQVSKLCMGCHKESLTIRSFEWETAWKRIGH